MTKVLITGGTGLVGQHLCEKLQQKGYEVAILSRSKRTDTKIPVYAWDVDRNEIDKEAINSCDYIIHLAGVNIGEKRWTAKRKQEVIDSRVKSTELIFNNIDHQNKRLIAFITASAVGYYGTTTSDKIFSETEPAANDFLGHTCKAWESVADQFTELGVRTVKIRTGIVLTKDGGVLSKLSVPIKWGLGSALGNGRQYMPWIHIDDLCNIYIDAIENSQMTGAYNAVSPEHLTNTEFTKKVARNLSKPLLLPKIPAFLLKLIFGEMATILIHGSRISSQKIINQGFKFKYPTLESALKQIFKKYENMVDPSKIPGL